MKAILAITHGLPDTLAFKDIPAPVPGNGEVLINVRACSISYPDLLMIQDKYQVKPPLPFSPGGEVAGEIASVGETTSQFKTGDRVVALSGWGGLAEQIVVKSNRVFTLPPEVDFINGSCTLYTYGTSYHALKDRARLNAGETLLVLGAAGGVGLAAVELGKVMGAKVIAAASSAEKLKVCKEKGADHLINYSTEDLRSRLKEITGGKGIDVAYDPVGGTVSEQALRSMAWNGRYLVVGFASGVIPQFPANIPLLKGCAIIGVFWGGFSEREPESNRQNMAELMSMVTSGKISQHIDKIYALEEAPVALNDLLNRKVKGKAVVRIGNQ